MDQSLYSDVKWFTWDYAMQVSIASHNRYEILVQSAGGDANLGPLQRYRPPEGRWRPLACNAFDPSAVANSPAGARKKRKTQTEDEEDAPVPQEDLFSPSGSDTGSNFCAVSAARSKSMALSVSSRRKRVTGEDLPQDGLIPPANASSPVDLADQADSEREGEKDAGSEGESSFDEVEDHLEAAEAMQWFSQKGSKVTHFYRHVNKDGNPIPLCHCKNDPESGVAFQQAEGVRQGFGVRPEHDFQGFRMFHLMAKRAHDKCLGKLPPNIAQHFEEKP
jgi:hypothetical protein